MKTLLPTFCLVLALAGCATKQTLEPHNVISVPPDTAKIDRGVAETKKSVAAAVVGSAQVAQHAEKAKAAAEEVTRSSPKSPATLTLLSEIASLSDANTSIQLSLASANAQIEQLQTDWTDSKAKIESQTRELGILSKNYNAAVDERNALKADLAVSRARTTFWWKAAICGWGLLGVVVAAGVAWIIWKPRFF